MWAYNSIFYQIYPIGFCGAPVHNDGVPAHRILKIGDWAEYLGNVKYELSRQERCERNTELITKAGYNIETEAENLMRIYKNL